MSRTESEVLCEMWATATQQGQDRDWKEIEAVSCKGNPPCAQYIRALSKFLQTHTGELLSELQRFQKAFPRPGTQAAMGGEFLMAVGELDLGQEKVPTIAIALLETCLMSPKIVDGFYRTIPPSKAKMLKSKTTRKAVLRGEQVLEDARRLARKLGVLERPEATGLLGW